MIPENSFFTDPDYQMVEKMVDTEVLYFFQYQNDD